MKRKAYLSAVIGLLATFGLGGSIDIIATAEASSPGSHSSHSLAGRFFKVNVKDLDLGTWSSNCYSFLEDGTWVDPLFVGPTPEEGLSLGTWVQHSGGFVTRYTAFARTLFPVDLSEFGLGAAPLRLIQNGKVIRAWHRSYLQAYSTLVFNTDDGDIVIGNFLSIGYSVNSCE